MDTQPSLSPIRQQQADRAADEAKEKAKLKTERQLAQDNFKRLDMLKKDENFIWYTENVIRPMVIVELGNSLDLTRDRDARDNSTHRHDLGQAFLKALEDRRLFWANQGGIQL